MPWRWLSRLFCRLESKPCFGRFLTFRFGRCWCTMGFNWNNLEVTLSSPMERMLDSVRVLPSIPKALQEIMQTLNKTDVSPNQITEPLSSDPALSGKVLRMSNAAHYGLQRQVGSVEEAVLLVGMNAVRTMVIASGLMGSFNAIPGFDMKRFWRLSLLSGYLARELAPSAGLHPEESYTAALMHGLGVLAIHGAFPEAAAAIDRRCSDKSPCDRADYEFDQLGFHHGDVGAEIAVRWKLPDRIGTAIRYYSNPKRTGASDMAGIVHCAVALAIDLEDGVDLALWGDKVRPELAAHLHVNWEQVRLQAARMQSYRELTDAMVS